MRIPAFASANIENTVAGVGDNVTAITEMESERFTGGGHLWKENAEAIVTAGVKLLLRKTFILEKRERRAIVQGNGFNLKGARQLNENNLFVARQGAKIDRRGADKRIIGLNRCVDVIMEGIEGNMRRRGTGKGVGTPDIVVRSAVGSPGLADEDILGARVVEEDIEGAGNNAIDAGMEKMARRGVELFHEDALRVRRIKLLEFEAPKGDEAVVLGGCNTDVAQLFEQVLCGIVCETHVRGEELLIENGSAEKTRQLLFFDWVTRKREGVAEAGEDESRDAAFKGFKKRDSAFGEKEGDVCLADFDAVLARYGVNGLIVEAKRVERSEDLARGGTGANRAGQSCAGGVRHYQ